MINEIEFIKIELFWKLLKFILSIIKSSITFNQKLNEI